MNHPKKDVTIEDVEENAHLDTSAAKLINYVGSSVSHSELMRGQVLGIDKGVTGAAFSLGN